MKRNVWIEKWIFNPMENAFCDISKSDTCAWVPGDDRNQRPKWRERYSASQLEDSTCVSCQFFPNCSTDSLQFSQNYSKIFFVEIDKLVLKFIWKNKNFTTAKAILTKKSKVGGFTLYDF